MTALADRIDYGTLTALVNARPDDPSRKALSAALHGINQLHRADHARQDRVLALGPR